ncbi:DinB family protein [Terriglobus roseus]|uniref:DinB superfamily protein n=1 Tax=Terriglobus roseus TaxID=392734 RepID=A0A1H4TP65_9BACT|nr:DinB family protein [Terriglobus roseus]SEC57891.1 DinB superfamily protein [Terriglobus roseus]
MAEHEVEPWLRGTHTDIDPVRRAVVHALELAEEDVHRWTRDLDSEALELEPLGLPSVAFQMRHIARSIDRLTTYASAGSLSEDQLLALGTERTPGNNREALFQEFTASVRDVRRFVMTLPLEDLIKPRSVGRAGLPTTLAGLMIHIAEHTQRHTGQLITTAKVVMALRDAQGS